MHVGTQTQRISLETSEMFALRAWPYTDRLIMLTCCKYLVKNSYRNINIPRHIHETIYTLEYPHLSEREPP